MTTQKKSHHHVHKDQNYKQYEINAVEACTNTFRWRNNINIVDKSNTTLTLKAWTLPSSDFANLLNTIADVQQWPNIRLYIGIEGNGEFNLMVVAVDDLGNDVINLEDPENSGVYDFSQPCPPTCDQHNSPLAYGMPTQ